MVGVLTRFHAPLMLVSTHVLLTLRRVGLYLFIYKVDSYIRLIIKLFMLFKTQINIYLLLSLVQVLHIWWISVSWMNVFYYPWKTCVLLSL